MRTLILAASLVGPTLLGGALAPARAADAKPDLGANAALQYWQAFSTMHAFDLKENQKYIDKWDTIPLDDDTKQIIANSRIRLQFLHRGAAIKNCDWGLTKEDGILMILPHLAQARNLARLAYLRARLEFEQGKAEAAVDDIADAFALGRHATTDGSAIAALVALSIDVMGQDLLAAHLKELDAATLKHLAARLEALPPGMMPRDSLKFEKECGTAWLLAQLKKTKQEEWPQFLASINARPEDIESIKKAGKPEEAYAALEKAGAYLDELAKLFPLPPDEFKQKVAALKEKMNPEAHPVAKMVLPAIERIYQAELRARVRRQLFAAAIAIAKGGKDHLKDFPDPVDGKPFEYVEREKGFELRSRFMFQDKPTVLTVGPKKE